MSELTLPPCRNHRVRIPQESTGGRRGILG